MMKRRGSIPSSKACCLTQVTASVASSKVTSTFPPWFTKRYCGRFFKLDLTNQAFFAGVRPDGMLIGSVQPTQQWFVRRSLHCLVVGTCEAGIMLPSVDADHHATARHAGALFLRKGHRRIVLVRSDATTGGDSETERGLREVLASSPSATLHVLRHRSLDHLVALLDQTLRAHSPPTAFFVLRPAHALTVTMHLLRRGRRIPQDAAVIGRDDEDYLAHTSPAITRYGGVGERLARDISRLVRTVAETRTLNLRAIRLMPKFIAGETV